MESLAGVIEIITYHDESSGFCVLKIRTEDDRHLKTVVGHVTDCYIGEEIECQGVWIENSKYGQQFKAESIRLIPPKSLAGIERYLASGMVRGIGKHFAKTLIKAFGREVLEVIEHHPERLKEIPGIGQARQESVIQAWAEQKQMRDLMVFLHSLGLGTNRVHKIYKRYGESAVEEIKRNPYCLMETMHGIGFATADHVASKLGVIGSDDIRIQAGLKTIMQQGAQAGHCALMQEDLIHQTCQLLAIQPDDIDHRVLRKLFHQEDIDGRTYLYQEALYHHECDVATHLMRLSAAPSLWAGCSMTTIVEQVNAKLTIALSPSQKEALKTILSHKVCFITGGPGVGKTTLMNAVLEATAFAPKSLQVALAAPTGRAAKRMSENSQGLVAKTLHRLLEFDVQTFSFKRNRYHTIPADLIIIDEVSMMDVGLMANLCDAIADDAQVVWVGDADQLPAIGPGMVLRDCLACERMPSVRLTEIFRQGQASMIIKNAHRFNQGLLPEMTQCESDYYSIEAKDPEKIQSLIQQMIQKNIPASFNKKFPEDIQVLTPMQRGPLGAKFLNQMLQKVHLNGRRVPGLERHGELFQLGDKVMQIANNYDKKVFNGDIGRIYEVDVVQKKLVVRFGEQPIEYELEALDELTLAYAITIHKSQGSEFPVVILPITMGHFVMLERNLIYTAMTRAKSLLVLIGEKKALAMAAKKLTAHARCTHLTRRLNLAMACVDDKLSS